MPTRLAKIGGRMPSNCSAGCGWGRRRPGSCLGGAGNLGEHLAAFPPDCHASGRALRVRPGGSRRRRCQIAAALLAAGAALSMVTLEPRNSPARQASATPVAGVKAAEEDAPFQSQVVSASSSADFIHLVRFSALCEPSFRDELQVSPAQTAKLREISAQGNAELGKIVWPLCKAVVQSWPRQRGTEVPQLHSVEQIQKAAAKSIEEVLTPRQTEAYKDRTFPFRAYSVLRHPEVVETLGLTPSATWATAATRSGVETADAMAMAATCPASSGPGNPRAARQAAGGTCR